MEIMAETTKKQLIGSLTKGLIIMETLLKRDKMGVTEFSKVLGVNKSSAYRLLSTLEERGFVEQESASGKYKLGMKMAQFRTKVLDGMELRDISQPFLKRLTERTNEASSICVLSNNLGIVIEKQNSLERINANPYIGMIEPLYCTALGKALLSSLPEEEQIKLLDALTLTAYTPKTMTDTKQILEDIKRTAAKGVAIDDEEYSLGMRCLAAPVYNHKGEVVASIGISGPLMRIRTDMLDEYSVIVKKISGELSALLGYIA